MKIDVEQMKELQKVELDIFKVFVEICKKLNVRYYLIAGTLLGAVRHKGFIPWDDDIDVGMMREDYDIFVEKARALLPDHLFLQTCATDEEYPHVFAKIRNSNTTFVETSVRDNKINHGIYIDIFPLDKCHFNTRKTFTFKLKERLLSLRVSSLYKNLEVSSKVRLGRAIITLRYPSAKKALRKLDLLYRSIPDGEAVINFSSIYGSRELMPTEWYGDGCEIEFEGLKVTAPCEYDKWLTQVYGDYMKLPPVEKRVTHHETVLIDTHQSFMKNKENAKK